MANEKIYDLPRTDAITGNEVVLLTTPSANPTADLNFISAWFNAKPTAYNFGALNYEPTVSPFDGGPIPIGAQYYNTVLSQFRVFGNTGWFVPNIDAQEFAATGGAALIGSGNGETVQEWLDFLASFAATYSGAVRLRPGSILIGTDPNYAAIAVNFTRTTIDRHAFEDWSILNTTDTNLGYCSYDAKATMNNALQQNHFVGYQSRNIYNGAGNLTTYFRGYDTAMVHNGAGTIAKAHQVYLKDVGGAGPITDDYGIYIEAIARGSTNNYAIYSAGGKWFCAGSFEATTILSAGAALGINFGLDVVNKTIAYGFGTGGQTQFGRHDFYDGKNGLIFRINSTGATLATGLTTTTQNFNINYGSDVAGKNISIGVQVGAANFGTVDFYDGKSTRIGRFSSTGLAVTGVLSTTTNLTAGGVIASGKFTVAGLPSATEGDRAYCTNGRKVGEGAGAGTGVPVYYSSSVWRRYSDDTVVAA